MKKMNFSSSIFFKAVFLLFYLKKIKLHLTRTEGNPIMPSLKKALKQNYLKNKKEFIFRALHLVYFSYLLIRIILTS